MEHELTKDNRTEEFSELENLIGYHYRNRALLEEAITTSSYAKEHPGSANYQELEFLGDRVISLILARHLYASGSLDEGKMTFLKAELEKNEQLAEFGEQLGLRTYIRASEPGEEISLKVIADVFEAICGAIYWDSHGSEGMQKVEKFLQNFLYTICGCKRTWTIDSFVEEQIEAIRAAVGRAGKVICGLSGGIDSATTALLVHEAIGDRLTCVFVDNGLLREGEKEAVLKTFATKLQLNLVSVDARERFLERLHGITDAEAKRKVIGELFITIFEEEAQKRGNAEFLAQGTIYPDRIESARASSRMSSRIKSHHNVGGLPEQLRLKLLEPIKELYKDEVRAVAKELGMPAEILNQHPFPGPGLAARIIGEITVDKLRICRGASRIVEEELKRSGLYDSVWQAFAIVGDDLATGVLGDARSLGRIVTIRVVESREAMTADFVKLPYELLERMSRRITNEVKGVTWVTYAISSKPPATIEPC